MNKRKPVAFTELNRCRVSPKRQIVISECSYGGYTIAQELQMEDDNGKPISIFLKNPLQVKDVSSLERVRDMLNLVIQEERSKE